MRWKNGRASRSVTQPSLPGSVEALDFLHRIGFAHGVTRDDAHDAPKNGDLHMNMKMSRRLVATVLSMLVMPAHLAADDLHVVSNADFESSVLNSPGPTVVLFWAEWCGPCRMIEPSLEQISDAMRGKVTFAKLNVDENPMLAEKYGITSIPALIVFEAGNDAARRVGAAPKEKLQEWIVISTTK